MRQGAVNDILFIIVFSLSLLICGKVSADTGWQSGGDFQGAVEFGGTITPYDVSLPPWLWKTSGYTGFSNKISELTGNGTRLTVSAPH
ncbi:fimbrial, partial [Escherichia coli]|nr:fimbrial [Escherichia coli]